MLKTQVNGLTWRALIPQVRGSWNIVCHLVSLIFWPTQCLTHCSSEKLHIWSSWKGRDIHSSIFPHNQSFTKEEKESADAGELSSWISGRIFFSFILLSTACLILIKPILHSCLFVFHCIGWRYLLHSLTLRNKLRSDAFNFRQILILSQRRGEINRKSGGKKREDAQTLFPEIPSAKLTSPEDSTVEKAD